MKKLAHTDIVARQSQNEAQPRFPAYALLNNIRSLYNVGSMFRTADGARLAKLYLCGTTGYPPARKVLKTALGATEAVPWQYHPSAVEVIRCLRREGVSILLLEQTDRSRSYDQIEVQYPVLLVVGNEVGGVDDELVRLADGSIEIPMYGSKNSLNVAVAFGIVVYELVRQYRNLSSSDLSPPASSGVVIQ